MHKKKLVTVFAIFLFLLTSGCALHRDKNPHNDVLVFGTSTKFALDVSAPVQNASIPEFTLGYKRLEAVWMPLKPNGKVNENPKSDIAQLLGDIKICMQVLGEVITDKTKLANFCLTSILPADKYVSLSSGINQDKGGSSIEMDTYSVFASLGAKGTLGFNSASGNLAQFFATGVAAQRLGANQAVGYALNADAPKAVEAAASVQNNKLELQIAEEKKNAKIQVDFVSKGKLEAERILGAKALPVDSVKRASLASKMVKMGSACNDTYLSGLDQSSVEEFINELKFQCLTELGRTVE